MSAVMLERIESIPNLKVARNAALGRFTSFGVGGKADILATAEDATALRELVRAARDEGLPISLLGGGTNLLVLDGGVRGVVLRLGEAFEEVSAAGARLWAGGAASLVRCASAAQKAGLSGFEFAAALPGTVGGALHGNAGAHGGDVGSIVSSVRAVSFRGEELSLRKDEIEFSYRKARFPEPLLVVEATFDLSPAEPREVQKKMDAHRDHRRRTQPLKVRNAGSVFKNPKGDYAGRLLDAAGVKGLRVGGASVSTLHANFIVNEGSATAKDVLDLAVEMRRRVQEHSGVDLEMEIRIVGEP